MVEAAHRDSRGILHPGEFLQRFRLERVSPSPNVARFVDRYWFVHWSLPPGESHVQQVLVHPVVQVVFEAGAATVSGIRDEVFSRVLVGEGRVIGVMFRPGGFRPFLDGPVSALAGQVLPVEAILPGSRGLTTKIGDELAADTPDEDIANLVDDALAQLLPDHRHPCEDTIQWAELAATDRDIRRVDDLADAFGVGIRTLQRCFSDHVGVGPKSFIRRYRLYEVAERAARDESLDWAAIARELGYADQAHLTRDFTAAVGEPPDRYAKRQLRPETR